MLMHLNVARKFAQLQPLGPMIRLCGNLFAEALDQFVVHAVRKIIEKKACHSYEPNRKQQSKGWLLILKSS